MINGKTKCCLFVALEKWAAKISLQTKNINCKSCQKGDANKAAEHRGTFPATVHSPVWQLLKLISCFLKFIWVALCSGSRKRVHFGFTVDYWGILRVHSSWPANRRRFYYWRLKNNEREKKIRVSIKIYAPSGARKTNLRTPQTGIIYEHPVHQIST